MAKKSETNIINQAQSSPPAAIRMHFIADYVKKIELYVKKNYYALSKLKNVEPKTEFQILPKYIALANSEYEVALEVKLKMLNSSAEETIFDLALECASVYRLEGTEDTAIIEAALLVDGVTLLFPFLRQEVARVILSSGFAPIKLDPLDFKRLYIEHKTKSLEGDAPQES